MFHGIRIDPKDSRFLNGDVFPHTLQTDELRGKNLRISSSALCKLQLSVVFLSDRVALLQLTLMGLTKQYLRYAPSAVFGVIGSQKANVAYVTLRGGERGRYVAVAACEHVFIWDVRKGEKVGLQRAVVTVCGGSSDGCVCPCPGSDPAGAETRGELPVSLPGWSPRCRGLRGRGGADLQPAERWKQHRLQRPQNGCHCHELWRSRGAARHRLQGERRALLSTSESVEGLMSTQHVWLHRKTVDILSGIVSIKFLWYFRTPTWSCGTSSTSVACTASGVTKTSSHRPYFSKTRISWSRGNTPVLWPPRGVKCPEIQLLL